MEIETSAPSRFNRVLTHPATIEVVRFTAYIVGGSIVRWGYGKALTAYKQRHQSPAVAPSARKGESSSDQVVA